MADYEIKTTLTLGGDQQYRSSLKQINNELRMAKSNMTAATSAYAKNDTSAAALAARQNGLANVYEAQRKKVELLRGKLDELREGGSASAEEIDRLQMQLNTATAQMNRTGLQLDQVNQSLEGLEDAGEAAGDGLSTGADAATEMSAASEEAGEHAEGLREKLLAIGKTSFEAVIAGLAALTAAAAAALAGGYALASGAGDYADGFLTLSQQTGISTDALQRWSYASRIIDVDTSTITGSMRRMIMAMDDAAGGSKSAQAKFDALGLTIRDQAGNLKDSETLFYEAVDALGQVENQTKRDALAMDLFGKSAQDLNPLILAGTDAWRELGDEAEANGNVFSEAMMAKMGTFDDAQEKLSAGMESLKTGIGMATMDAFLPLVEAGTEAMAEVNLAIQNGLTGDELTAAINRALGKMDGAFDGVFNLVDSIGGLIAGQAPAITGKVLEMIGSVAKNVSAKFPEIIKGLLGMLPGLIGDLGAAVPEIVTNVTDGIGTLMETAIASIPQWAPQLGLAILNTFAAGIKGVAGMVDSLFKGVLGAVGMDLDVNARVNQIMDGIDKDKTAEILAQITGRIDTDPFDGTVSETIQHIDGCFDSIVTALTDGLPDTADVIAELNGQVAEVVQESRDTINAKFDAMLAEAVAQNASAEEIQEIENARAEALGSIDETEAGILGWIDSMKGKSADVVMQNIGYLETLIQQLKDTTAEYEETRENADPNKRAYEAVSGGYATDTTTIGVALNYVLTNKNEAEEQLRTERDEALAAAQTDAEKKEISVQYELDVADAQAEYEAQLNTLFAGLTGSVSDSLNEAMAQAQAQADLADGFMQQLVDAFTNRDFSGIFDIVGQMNEAIGTDFDPSVIYAKFEEAMMNGEDLDLSWMTPEIQYQIDQSMLSAVEGADFGAFGEAFAAAVQSGMLKDTDLELIDIASLVVQLSNDGDSAGSGFDEGLAAGIRNNTSKITAAAKEAARKAFEAAKEELQINSPSKKMIAVGASFDEGFASGIDRSADQVMRSVQVLSESAVTRAQTPVQSMTAPAAPAGTQGGAQGGDTTVNVQWTGPYSKNDAGIFGQYLARSILGASQNRGG